MKIETTKKLKEYLNDKYIFRRVLKKNKWIIEYKPSFNKHCGYAILDDYNFDSIYLEILRNVGNMSKSFLRTFINSDQCC